MSRLSELQKLKIKTILIITILWMIFLSLVFLYEYSSYKFRFPDQYNTLDPWLEYRVLMLASILAGLIGGSIFIYNINTKAQKRPFYYGILLSAIYFLLTYLFISFSMSIIVLSIQEDQFPFHPDILKTAFENLFVTYQLRNILLWTFIVAITQFILQINDKFGPGNLWKMFIGKYYSPQEELRVFMFLDLKSSTTIAENLGHQKYYHLLNDYYALISDPIINRSGEIFQYVGDEVVVSWTTSHAIKNMNCLYCFYDIKSTIKKNQELFLDKYGLIPEFKAGIHFGPVTTGEVGVIKRDILFTGDVLNTTSRIQSSCNELRVDLLISENTLALFDNLNPFQSKLIGSISLKGKEKKVSVYSLDGIE